MSLLGIGVEDDSENSWITKLKNNNNKKKKHKKQKYTQDITLTTCRKERNSLFSS